GMGKEIEIERKTLVSKETFKRLISQLHIGEGDFKLQRNHYFETDDFQLKKQSSALRIREKEAIFTFTLKQPHPAGLLETNQTLSKQEAKLALESAHFPSGEVMDALRDLSIPISQLKHIGTLSTSRAEISYEQGILCLDHSSYLGIEDYEIEFEGTSEEHATVTFQEILKTFSISQVPTENKIQRFFSKKEKN
uniref:BH2851 n=1 Tax=Halalkalibacterium halodurans TaxID=86665 RepID=UPI0000D6F7E5